MKDFGIITLYYKNCNCGGLLQAYAMQKCIEQLGYSCELISYNREQTIYDRQPTSIKNRLKRIPIKIANKFYSSMINERRNAFFLFEKNIPHSSEVYTDNSITEAMQNYKGFVSGSDQIWNPNFCSYADFLCFADNRKKIAYAASLGVKSLNEKVREDYCNMLSDFDAVSVRERNAIEQLKEASVPIEYVLDPTMLISAEEWGKLTRCSGSEKYIFVYLLGDNKYQRKIIEEYAKIYELPIITFKHVKLNVRFSDIGFKAKNVPEGGPIEFVEFIKGAEVVFTDSFHAVVFSILFHKQFYVINRFSELDRDSQNIRLHDIMERFGIADRCIYQKVEILSPIDYSMVEPLLQKQREASMLWLKDALHISKDKKVIDNYE